MEDECVENDCEGHTHNRTLMSSCKRVQALTNTAAWSLVHGSSWTALSAPNCTHL